MESHGRERKEEMGGGVICHEKEEERSGSVFGVRMEDFHGRREFTVLKVKMPKVRQRYSSTEQQQTRGI